MESAVDSYHITPLLLTRNNVAFAVKHKLYQNSVLQLALNFLGSVFSRVLSPKPSQSLPFIPSRVREKVPRMEPLFSHPVRTRTNFHHRKRIYTLHAPERLYTYQRIAVHAYTTIRRVPCNARLLAANVYPNFAVLAFFGVSIASVQDHPLTGRPSRPTQATHNVA
ncbi:hypothetical protein PHLCEN_2v3925 [Hermanssonia centrifuga]|uniref:Uncharacterized protein n=1 Tax=Hermanssonia centrifuga TaxID=98765 RepID=A0A2R6QB38_9APHY|nr:hypothetical protein PHLCEN_2v3925 [Hermanssonia centrifuga]